VGIEIIMNKILGEKIKGYILYDKIIILVKFQTKPKDTIVVQVYVPTTNSSDVELIEVYENIDKLIENVKGKETIVIMSDWKTIVGEEKVKNLTGFCGL